MLIINKEYSGLNKAININLYKKDWQFSGEYNINKLLELYNIEKLISIRDLYFKLLKNLNTKDINVHFKYLLGDKLYNERVEEIKEKITNLKNISNPDYINVLEKRIEFTGNFTSTLYDDEIIKASVYDHTSSKTGRVKVSGKQLNYLTLKKDHRSKIKSQFVNGKIFVIDIVSLEPRILLHLNGIKDIYDIYTHVGEKLNLSNTRPQIKLGIISTIYGGNYNTVKKVSGLDSEAVKKIKNYFGVNNLYNKFKDEDIIQNHYGRPIKVTNTIVNHFIQSTSADCACLAFYKLMNDWKGLRINFLAFIHDAIIIDVHPSSFDIINSIEYIYDDNLGIKLPVKVEDII